MESNLVYDLHISFIHAALGILKLMFHPLAVKRALK